MDFVSTRGLNIAGSMVGFSDCEVEREWGLIYFINKTAIKFLL